MRHSSNSGLSFQSLVDVLPAYIASDIVEDEFKQSSDMATIQAEAVANLKAHINRAVEEADGVPGVQYYAVNKNGEYIFEHTAGKVGVGKQQDMGPNNVCWMASCTKLYTAVAAMQLVEQGKLALDDVELVEKLAPVTMRVELFQLNWHPDEWY